MKKCRNPGCEATFEAYNSFQIWCSPSCGYEISQIRIDKKRKKESSAMRKAYREKDKKWWKKQVKIHLHWWIVHVRDRDKGCVTCGSLGPKTSKYMAGGYFEAGHYKTVGAHPELQYENTNIHKQCTYCNRHKGGAPEAYSKAIIQLYGQGQLDWLNGPHEQRKYTIDDYRMMRDKYRDLSRHQRKINRRN